MPDLRAFQRDSASCTGHTRQIFVPARATPAEFEIRESSSSSLCCFSSSLSPTSPRAAATPYPLHLCRGRSILFVTLSHITHREPCAFPPPHPPSTRIASYVRAEGYDRRCDAGERSRARRTAGCRTRSAASSPFPAVALPAHPLVSPTACPAASPAQASSQRTPTSTDAHILASSLPRPASSHAHAYAVLLPAYGAKFAPAPSPVAFPPRYCPSASAPRPSASISPPLPRALPTPAARQHQHTRRPAPLHASARTPCMPLASAYASPRRRTLTAPAHDIRKRVPLATSAHASTPRCARARDPAHACPSALHREPAWCPPRIARGVADERFVCQPRPLRVARA
ncbi:hypothetical protein PLICRDRAFT_181211 [Plicaturopsis crispa FD-325 SS-3]|uniref:Uncharacterized protein n=1 Tax=Plicaturopsis crispa FD-325 SS-3 TaxID=944288 RepID=A0A0C9T3G7_PLICR|nr:hypothetical protein PLICRDRAFT_181211 [Plicaturopsis crispa FD-325 SS-3]